MEAFPGEGEWIDGYRIGERIHSGGMGIILRVTPDVDPGFPVIMKVPRLGYGEPGEAITSYEQEQMVMSVMQGPFAPRYVGAGDLATQPYLVHGVRRGDRALASGSGRRPSRRRRWPGSGRRWPPRSTGCTSRRSSTST